MNNFQMGLSIWKSYWRVSTLRDTPANTVYSHMVLVGSVLLFCAIVAIQLVLLSPKYQNGGSMFIMLLMLLFSYSCYTYLLLYFTKKSNRYLQTLACILMAYVIVHLMAMPLVLIGYYAIATKVGMEILVYLNSLYLTMTLIFTIWQFLALAHIYRHALDVDFLRGVLASFGLLAFNLLIFSLIR